MRRHTRALALLLTAFLLGCGTTPPAPGGGSSGGSTSAPGASGSDAPEPRPLAVGSDAWVDVSVATLWRSPSSPRAVDAPALAQPARIGEWLAGMSVDQRRRLNGRADTQALLGDRVVVVKLRPHWAKVLVPGQPTPLNKGGYPGWVPRRQLTATAPAVTDTVATVVSQLAWLRVDEKGGAQVLRISFGTRLPVVGTTGRWVQVLTPRGEARRILATQVSVHDPADAALPATRDAVVASATMFVGLDYLWAGRSGFGMDCSGFTSLVYRVHGRTLPRDAAPQSEAGSPVTRLRRGDLMFYATDGKVHHVSMYVGQGKMVHSPHTGSTVQVIATSTPAYAQEYAGARRFL